MSNETEAVVFLVSRVVSRRHCYPRLLSRGMRQGHDAAPLMAILQAIEPRFQLSSVWEGGREVQKPSSPAAPVRTKQRPP